MRLHYSLDFIISCLVLTSLFLFAESAPQNFTYIEKTTDNDQTPRITDLQTYDDGTILVRMARRSNTLNSTATAIYLDPVLAFRLINPDGTVTEVNINNSYANLDPVNFRLFSGAIGTQNPISIWSLRDRFILVNYVNMTDPSDIKTYEDWGMVVDWSGNIHGRLRYGKSYINSRGQWEINLSLTLNVNRKLGFFRLTAVNGSSALWQQILVDDSGNLSILSQDYINIQNYANLVLSTFATVDGGYAIAYINSLPTTTNNTNPFKSFTGVYAIFLSYGQNTTGTQRTLFETTVSNLITQSMKCDLAFVGVGHVCTVVTFTTAQNRTTGYLLKINFLSSGSVVSTTSTRNQDISLNNTVMDVLPMPFGGYLLKDTFTNNNSDTLINFSAYGINDTQISLDLQQPITPNLFGLTTIIKKNNTLVIALQEDPTSWTLLTDQMPKVDGDLDHGYGNLMVDTTVPAISAVIQPTAANITITFYDPVDLSDGNITIYQNINSSSVILRQMISARDAKCHLGNDTRSITVDLISSTFNQPKAQYFVQIDNNFVKSRNYREPLLGIDSRVWWLTAGTPPEPARSASVTGILRLNPEASQRFQRFSSAQRNDFFSTLLKEISEMVPVRLARLSSDNKYQVVNSGTPSEQIMISIDIALPKDSDEEGVPKVKDDLNTMIKNKYITSISTGSATSGLDENYGFVASPDLWERYRFKLIGVFLAVTVFIIIFLIAQRRHRDGHNLAVLQLGLILFNFILEVLFIANNAKDIKQLFLPSILFLIIPLCVNTALAFYIISKENLTKEFYDWFYTNGKVASIFTVIAAADIEALMVLHSNLAGLSIFKAPFSPDAISKIFWGACANIFIKNIPLVVIQIIYYRLIVTYDIIPLLLLITSCLTLVINIIGRLYHAVYRIRNRKEPQYAPTDDSPDNNFGGLHPLQIPPSSLYNKDESIAPESPSGGGFLRRSGGKRNSRNSKRMSEVRSGEELTNVELTNPDELEDKDDGTLYGGDNRQPEQGAGHVRKDLEEGK
ncbi:16547_t:CDS:10 [Acaulospora morrowiae]|uniref:16547_t:CDS:1 n=1 Tax=Acaulospora morrowiae TaxID=94023 RepID=A0A9N9A2Z3_9GLOM|nr:16547_t:CDS:10 [Acaulospora morrowiae]